MITLRKQSGVRILIASAGLAGALLLDTPVKASEGGASFYLLGSGGPGAAELPPVEGVFFDNTVYYYNGEAGADRPLVVGGNVVLGLKAEILADFATVLWVPSTNALGGTLALGAAVAVGHPDVNVSAVLTGPRGGQITVTREDRATLFGDPVLTAALSWDAGENVAVQFGTTVNVPIGTYREDELANISFHRWILDTSVAATWRDEEAGWDVSGKAGLTFNGTNEYTDYKTGTEFHLEASVERMFSKQFSAGLQGYYFQQVTGDSGSGATLGENKGRVLGLGATAAYNFEIGKTPVSARLRVFEEFNVERRLEGTAVLFSLSFPLLINPPKPSAAQ